MKLVVIGGSSGGLDPLKTILADLPEAFDAAVLVLRHSWPTVPSLLARVLTPVSALPVEEVADGATVRPGRVFVSPSGANVTVEGDGDAAVFRLEPCVSGQRGRPSIDRAMSTAASAFGEDCIGVVLSGYLDDGTAGAIEIEHHDGVVIVQAPSDAEQASMPLNVIRRDSPEYVLPDVQIAGAIARLVSGELDAAGLAASAPG